MLPEEYNELKEPVAETTQNERKKPNCWRLIKFGVLTLCFLFIGITSFLYIDVGKHQKCDECAQPYKQDGKFCRNGENVYKNDCTMIFPHMVYGMFFFIPSATCCFVAFLEFMNDFVEMVKTCTKTTVQ